MTASDINTIRRALKQADKSHMRQEFKEAYRNLDGCQYDDGHPYSGYGKCWCALYEWDLLDFIPGRDKDIGQLDF